LASTKTEEVNPPTEDELPLKVPPPKYPPTDISVCENIGDDKNIIKIKNSFIFNYYPFNFVRTKI
jgi:hypothetical protein